MEGLAGVIGVELIGQIRRAFFEQRRAIKEISRELRVSRTTVRKVVRGIDASSGRKAATRNTASSALPTRVSVRNRQNSSSATARFLWTSTAPTGAPRY